MLKTPKKTPILALEYFNFYGENFVWEADGGEILKKFQLEFLLEFWS